MLMAQEELQDSDALRVERQQLMKRRDIRCSKSRQIGWMQKRKSRRRQLQQLLLLYLGYVQSQYLNSLRDALKKTNPKP